MHHVPHPPLTQPTAAADARPIAIVLPGQAGSPFQPQHAHLPASALGKRPSASSHHPSPDPNGVRTARPCSLDTSAYSAFSTSPSDQLSSTLESTHSIPPCARSLGAGVASESLSSHKFARSPSSPAASRARRTSRALAFVPNRHRRRASVPGQMSTPELKAMLASLSGPSAQYLSPTRREQLAARRAELEQELHERQSMHQLQTMVARTSLDPIARDQNEMLAQLGNMSLRPPGPPPGPRDGSSPSSSSLPAAMCLSPAESAALFRQVWQAEQDELLPSEADEWAPGVDTLTFEEEDE